METKKTQSTKYEEDNMSAVRSCTKGSHFFIQSQSIFTHVLSNIVWDSYRKSSEEQDSME